MQTQHVIENNTITAIMASEAGPKKVPARALHENLKFMQIYAVAVRVECPTLSLFSLRFVNLSFLCSAVSAARRARSLQCHSLSYIAMVLVLFSKYPKYSCSVQKSKRTREL